MAQYPVPQFIDRETRLIGPLTVRQIIVLGTSAAILFVLFFILSFFAFTVAVVVLGSAGFALAFITINGKPLSSLLVSFFGFFLQPRTYLWGRKSEKKQKNEVIQRAPQKTPQATTATKAAPRGEPNQQQLKELAGMLDQYH